MERELLIECQRNDRKAQRKVYDKMAGKLYSVCKRYLKNDEDIEELYRDFGKFCKKNLAKWSYYIITSYEDFEKAFGKPATKNRKLYNGGIKCYYYQYFGDRKNGYRN